MHSFEELSSCWNVFTISNLIEQNRICADCDDDLANLRTH